MRAALLLLAMALHLASNGQSFFDHSTQQSVAVTNSALWGGGVSAYDFNSDGWPDLSFARENEGVTRFINNEGSFEFHDYTAAEGFVETEMALYADYDNDGDADLFVSNANGGSYLFQNVNGQLIDVTEQANIIQNPLAWTQGACWGDYDRDGYLDLYVCNYNWNLGIDNWLFHNNGDGTFTEVAQDLGVSNGSSPSFQAVFMDYNNDMWPDIFVINDRTPANAMYRNNGDGSFTNVTIPIGVGQSMDAMTASVSDFDKDGDQDIYVTNGPNGNILLENQEGVFVNIADNTNLEINQLCWGATWIDYNNSGYEDLYVCNQTLANNANTFFKNGPSGLASFTTAFNLSNVFSAHSSAKADFNRDGKQDLVVHAGSPDHARLFINQGDIGNSVQIKLEGVVSNRDGVGAWVITHLNGVPSYLFTMSGGGYMAQNSQYISLGIGNEDAIDMATIHWPSGHIDTFQNLVSGELITLIEGASEQRSVILENTVFCEGDSLYLEISEGQAPIWSNGQEGNGIWVSEPGEYSYTVLNTFGIPVNSNAVQIATSPSLVSSISADPPACFGESNAQIICTIEPVPSSFEWSSGDTALSILDAEAGFYQISFTNDIGCEYLDSVLVSQPDELVLTISTSNLACYGDSNGIAIITPLGGTGEYLINTFNEDFNQLFEGNYTVLVSDENGCTIESEFSIESPSALTVDPIITDQIGESPGSIILNTSGGLAPYQHYWSNGIQTEDLIDYDSGTYYITIVDENGCQLNEIITIDQLVNINELTVGDIELIPNPASSSVNFTLDNEIYFLRLYDMGGRLIEKKQVYGNESFSTENLTNGWYILYLCSSTAVYQAKLMVQH